MPQMHASIVVRGIRLQRRNLGKMVGYATHRRGIIAITIDVGSRLPRISLTFIENGIKYSYTISKKEIDQYQLISADRTRVFKSHLMRWIEEWLKQIDR